MLTLQSFLIAAFTNNLQLALAIQNSHLVQEVTSTTQRRANRVTNLNLDSKLLDWLEVNQYRVREADLNRFRVRNGIRTTAPQLRRLRTLGCLT